MTIFYSAKTNGFYPASHKADYVASPDGWPADAVAISEENYKDLIAGQGEGKKITADASGKPVLTDPLIDWQAQAESQRRTLLAEADSTTAGWCTDLNLGIIDDDERATLIKWRTYIKAVQALSLSEVTDEEKYKAIAWPDKPE